MSCPFAGTSELSEPRKSSPEASGSWNSPVTWKELFVRVTCAREARIEEGGMKHL